MTDSIARRNEKRPPFGGRDPGMFVDPLDRGPITFDS
jgi:hypothetical protein